MANSITGKKIFGAGRFFGINNVSNPTPMRAQVPQDISIDFKLSTKTLVGENKFPVAVAAGDMAVTGKVTLGANQARMFADLMFNVGSSTGTIIEQDKEAATVPASTPWQVTVANGSTWTTDLGVALAADGTVYTRVASSPATGQYTVAAGGIYTFATADAGKNVVISYLYTSSTSGEKLTVVNTLQGPAGAFTGVMVFPYGTDQDVLTLNNCIASDAGIATKQGDYAKPTFGFMAATDSSDTLGTFAFSQAA
jgi:hypothetical protein